MRVESKQLIGLIGLVGLIGLAATAQTSRVYWSVAHAYKDHWGPLPAPPTNTLQVWSVDGTNYWFDDRAFVYPTNYVEPAAPRQGGIGGSHEIEVLNTNVLLAHPSWLAGMVAVEDAQRTNNAWSVERHRKALELWNAYTNAASNGITLSFTNSAAH